MAMFLGVHSFKNGSHINQYANRIQQNGRDSNLIDDGKHEHRMSAVTCARVALLFERQP